MTVLYRIDGWWLRPLGPQPLAFFRIAVGLYAVTYLVIRWPNLVSNTGFEPHQFEPTGIVSILGEPLAAALVYGLLLAALASGTAFLLGWRYAISGPLFAVLLLWVITYRNSWGQVFHTENLLVLHVIALSLAPASDALSLDSRRKVSRNEPHIRYGWPLKLCGLITVIAYVIAGVTKLDTSGLAWVTSDILRNQVAFDNLRKELLGDYHSPLGTWLVAYGWAFKPLAAGTLAVELLAPLALFGRRIALCWIGAAWAFHVGVLATMAILFPYQLLAVAFIPLLAWDGQPIVDRVGTWTTAIKSQSRLAVRARRAPAPGRPP